MHSDAAEQGWNITSTTAFLWKCYDGEEKSFNTFPNCLIWAYNCEDRQTKHSKYPMGGEIFNRLTLLGALSSDKQLIGRFSRQTEKITIVYAINTFVSVLTENRNLLITPERKTHLRRNRESKPIDDS